MLTSHYRPKVRVRAGSGSATPETPILNELTVARDFRPLVIFVKQYPWVHWFMG
jgi:hypothetical protein